MEIIESNINKIQSFNCKEYFQNSIEDIRLLYHPDGERFPDIPITTSILNKKFWNISKILYLTAFYHFFNKIVPLQVALKLHICDVIFDEYWAEALQIDNEELVSLLNIFRKAIQQAENTTKSLAPNALPKKPILKAHSKHIADAKIDVALKVRAKKAKLAEQKSIVSATIKAAEQGNACAQYNIGCAYYYGKGVKQDYEQAVFWYQKAAEQGYIEAQNHLGRAYSNKDIVPNYEQALYWYQKAAEQGHADAQYNLGRAYEYGKGVEQNDEQAEFWFTKAAEQDQAEGQCNLAMLYGNAECPIQDYEKAVFWYTKSAEQGFIEAQYRLGLAYEHGEGVTQNYEQAVYWYTKAAEQGHTEAQNLLKKLENANVSSPDASNKH